ncbi:hypothetical protein [Coleofasciculus sp. H7-2]|uniref:hypothetical protein n=1 Tax=Coleofasciculus sp. H7-2 TaxID=3351545 RepID=UPI00366BCAEA
MPNLQAIDGMKAHPTGDIFLGIGNWSKGHLLLMITHYLLPITHYPLLITL